MLSIRDLLEVILRYYDTVENATNDDAIIHGLHSDCVLLTHNEGRAEELGAVNYATHVYELLSYDKPLLIDTKTLHGLLYGILHGEHSIESLENNLRSMSKYYIAEAAAKDKEISTYKCTIETLTAQVRYLDSMVKTMATKRGGK